jgi:hypothetical protein
LSCDPPPCADGNRDGHDAEADQRPELRPKPDEDTRAAHHLGNGSEDDWTAAASDSGVCEACGRTSHTTKSHPRNNFLSATGEQDPAKSDTQNE